MRKTNFQNGYYYHIYNRGVRKNKIFLNERDYLRFLKALHLFNQNKPTGGFSVRDTKSLSVPDAKLVDIIAYCFNPNHFHLLLRQKIDNGISTFLNGIQKSHTQYFNAKYKTSGSLFQGRFKDKPVKTDNYLLQVSCYINANYEIHGYGQAESWKWSSYQDYIDKRKGVLCDKKIILKDFQSISEYIKTTNDVIKHSKNIKAEKNKFGFL